MQGCVKGNYNKEGVKHKYEKGQDRDKSFGVCNHCHDAT